MGGAPVALLPDIHTGCRKGGESARVSTVPWPPPARAAAKLARVLFANAHAKRTCTSFDANRFHCQSDFVRKHRPCRRRTAMRTRRFGVYSAAWRARARRCVCNG